jgi:formylglycine-generating enzyme required for sulfatase activity
VGAYEVTQAQYEKVMGTNPSAYSAGGSLKSAVKGLETGQFPVDSVPWPDAVKFCQKLSALPAEKGARRVYRLPTEAEWEYACRAGTTTAFHFGDALSKEQACVAVGPRGRPAKVGSYKPNAWGLYDMHGNVWEWVADWWDQEYYRKSPKKDPTGPKAGTSRIARGGCWGSDGWVCRSAFRGFITPNVRHQQIGFRVACTVGGAR